MCGLPVLGVRQPRPCFAMRPGWPQSCSKCNLLVIAKPAQFGDVGNYCNWKPEGDRHSSWKSNICWCDSWDCEANRDPFCRELRMWRKHGRGNQDTHAKADTMLGREPQPSMLPPPLNAQMRQGNKMTDYRSRLSSSNTTTHGIKRDLWNTQLTVFCSSQTATVSWCRFSTGNAIY